MCVGVTDKSMSVLHKAHVCYVLCVYYTANLESGRYTT